MTIPAAGAAPGGYDAYYFPNGFKLDNDGFTAGLQIGYNCQVSQSFVWGVEADINWLDGKNRNSIRPAVINTLTAVRTGPGR